MGLHMRTGRNAGKAIAPATLSSPCQAYEAAHLGSGRSRRAGQESLGKTTPDACSACSFSRSACSCCVSACDSMLRSAAQPDSADDALNACYMHNKAMTRIQTRQKKPDNL